MLEAPYLMQVGDRIAVYIIALNVQGRSIRSEISDALVYQTEPKMPRDL